MSRYNRLRRLVGPCAPERLEPRQLLDGAGAVLMPDQFDLAENSAAQLFDLLENDQFDDNYPGQRELTAVSPASEGGRLRIAEDRRAVLYTPHPDFRGVETFTYFVDEELSSTVTVQVHAVLADDTFTFNPDGNSRRLDLLANDPFFEDYRGDRTITILSETSLGGTVELAPDGRSVTYQMPDGEYGKETFVYIVDDRYAARATIDISSPLRSDDQEVLQNAAHTQFDVLSNDAFWPEYDGARQITHVFGGRGDSQVEIASGGRAIAYLPGQDFHGYESLTYVVDGTFEANLQVMVRRPTRDDFVAVDKNSTEYFINLTANDRYRDRQQVERDVVDRVTSVGVPANGGEVSLAPGGQGVLYSPPPGFTGVDEFDYVADERYPATVRVTVSEPVRDDFLQVHTDTLDNRLDVLANDFFGDGYQGAREITRVGDTLTGGIVTLDASRQSLIYTPPASQDGINRSDSFEYDVDDQFTANVWVYVAPLASHDYFQFGSPAVVRLDVLENDHFGDAGYEGEGLITNVSVPSRGGEVTIIEGGLAILYTPGSDRDEFTYTVDGQHEARVTLDYPNRLAQDQATVDQNSSASSIHVLANDFRSASIQRNYGIYTGPRVITSVSETEHGGTVIISPDGKELSYTPATDYHGDDHFSYVVDGFLETSVTVHVIRRVRDDLFHVDSGSTENSLPVLLNDLLGADYDGAGRITDVSAGSGGAETAVAPDGRSVLLTPASSFSGEETFVYTVDGKLKAEGRVLVHESHEDPFSQFESLEPFKELLIEDALVRYDWAFGQQSGLPEFDDANLTPGGAGAADRVHSDTNVQVAGVDEADLVETDGDYLYSLNGGTLAITDAWPAEEMRLLSQTNIRGTPIGQYLSGDRLAVVSEIVEYPLETDFSRADVGAGFADPIIFPPFPPQAISTIVTVLDISNRTSPAVIQQTELDGEYVESRRIGEHVFLVLDGGLVALPAPESTCSDGQCTYESQEAYLERIESSFESLVEDILPTYASLGPAGNVVRSGVIIQPEDLYRPLLPDSRSLLSVLSINLANSEPGLAATAGIMTTGAANLYGSLENLYVFEAQNRWATEEGASVEILKFAWNGSTGEVEPVGTGSVPGRMVDQFSVDEFQDQLRIATTVSNNYSGNYSRRAENHLFVLEEDAGVLEYRGSLKSLAIDETIRSVRFFNERAFVVTFENVDPLIGIDLEDPADPRVAGHLTLPGFSQYMQFISHDRLLTVGRNTPNGIAGPAMVSLFNVAEVAQPTLIDQFTLPRFSETEASLDHHAFNWFSPQEVLAVPSARSYFHRVDRDGDGYRETREQVASHELHTFRIDVGPAGRNDNGIELLGSIAHESPVRRSVFIDDYVYSVGESNIKSAMIDDPEKVLRDVAIDVKMNEPAFGADHHAARDEMVHLQATARAHLADRLDTQIGSVMTVAVESHSSSLDEFNMVLRAADRHFAYQVSSDEIVLLNDEYVFSPAKVAVGWQNQDNAYDVDADGVVAPRDVGLLINDLNRNGARELPLESVVRQIDMTRSLLDVSGDGRATPIDVLFIINFINNRPHRIAAEGEGELALDAGGFDWRADLVADPELPQETTTSVNARASEHFSLPASDDRQVWNGHSDAAEHRVRSDRSLEDFIASLDRVFWQE